MFRSYYFNEMAYPHFPTNGRTMRTELPSSVMSPDVAHDLLHGYLDMWQAADELGMEIMVNEHHQTPSCMNSVSPLILSALARSTKRARLATLGIPLGNRVDPVRAAEEMAMIDVLSRGRLEVGLVVGSPHEVHATNTNPALQRERFWEGIDLLIGAMSSHDGPFNWEGRHHHHRQVNIWPRPYQTPHPPIWVTTISGSTVKEIADREFGLATVFIGTQNAKRLYHNYRKRCEENGRPAKRDKLGYNAIVYVGESDEEAHETGKKLQWFLTAQQGIPMQYHNVPAYHPAQSRVPLLRAEMIDLANPEAVAEMKNVYRVMDLAKGPVQGLIDEGIMFCGSAESVFQQMKTFYEEVGGFGSILALMGSEHMGVGLVTESMERYAKYVMPRFAEEVYERDTRYSPDGAPNFTSLAA